jgi:hypothetical protein
VRESAGVGCRDDACGVREQSLQSGGHAAADTTPKREGHGRVFGDARSCDPTPLSDGGGYRKPLRTTARRGVMLRSNARA